MRTTLTKERPQPVAEASGGDAVQRTRRRFVRRQWARRLRLWRWVVASLLLAGLLTGAVWSVWFSSLLTVRDVEVTGASATLTADQVRSVAQVPEGEPLARLQLAAVRARVGALADVRSVEVTRSWPHTVVVRVVERQPVAAVRIGAGYRAVDASGVLFRSWAKPPAGLPLVQTRTGFTNDVLREAAAVAAALPSSLASKVDHLEVASVDQVTLALKDGRSVVWGSSASSAEKAEILATLLKHPAKVYDVSVPGLTTTSNG